MGRKLFGEGGVVARVAKHLGDVVFVVADGDVNNFALVVLNRSVNGVDKAFVRCDVEVRVAVENFFVDILVDTHGIFLNEVASGFVVAFALDALNFAEELSEEFAQTVVVVDSDVCLATF